MTQAGQIFSAGEHHKRRPVLRFFEAGWYVFPVVLLAAAYFIPALQVPVLTDFSQLPGDLGWALLGMTVAAVIWLIGDFFVVSNLNTSVGSLRLNTWVSILLALALSIYAGWSLSAAGLAWGYVIPWVASIIDAFITADRAINNAAQKPLIQTRG